jgi:Zn-dependent M28 family amino/carboxypeptidase
MKTILSSLLLFAFAIAKAQDINTIINAAEVKRVESVLASDSLKGRKVFTPDIEKAAYFIGAEFKKAGLKPLKGAKSYRQEFFMLKPTLVSLSASADGKVLPDGSVVVISAKEELMVNEQSLFDTVTVGAKDNFFKVAIGAIQSGKNTVVFADSAFQKNFKRLANFAKQILSSSPTVIFVVAGTVPKQYSFAVKQSFEKLPLANIVGVLPGKSKRHEYVIFSGHYDHLGIGRPVKGDSIYNGANDDAAGTTAVILLAKYFKALHNNARTLVFAAFTAEEIGEYGSAYFSKQFDPMQVKAMFNIEMIGTESKWGKNSAYITGFEKTDMGKILQDNLKGSAFTFYPDPYTEQNLFYRSDNATLAKVGVPAHTISTSKMDNEPNYHKPSDEISTLDMVNMAEIIKAVALSSGTIVSGKDTPSRVKE